MNLVKIILAVLAGIILVLILALFVFIKTFDINRYLPQITHQASQTIGREVKIANADLNISILKGVYLELNNVSVSENPDFSDDLFLNIRQARLALNIAALVLERKIDIGNIVLIAPQIEIIRNKQGRMNIETLAPQTNTNNLETSENQQQSLTVSAPAGLPVVTIKSINIDEAQVRFVDLNPTFPLDTTIGAINIAVNNFSLTKAFDIVVKAQALSAKENIFINTQALIDLPAQKVMINDFQLKTDLSLLDWGQIRNMSNLLKQAQLPQEMTGQLAINIANLTATFAGAIDVKANILLNDSGIVMGSPIPNISQLSADMVMDMNDIDLRQFSLNMAGGSIVGAGKLNNFLTKQQYHMTAEIRDVQVGELINGLQLPVSLTGKIVGKLEAQGEGFDPAIMIDQLKVQGSFVLNEGVLERLNVVDAILGKTLSMIPGLTQMVDDSLNQVIQEKVGDKVKLEKAEMDFSMEDGIVFVDQALVQAKPFEINAKGSMPLAGNTDIHVAFILSQEISTDIVNKTPELQALLRDDKRLQIDGALNGQQPNFAFTPKVDLNKIGRSVLLTEGAKQLDKVIEKNPEVGQILQGILGGGQKAQKESTTNDTDVNQQEQEPESKELINGVLNKIFK